jgi:hypothetical protein
MAAGAGAAVGLEWGAAGDRRGTADMTSIAAGDRVATELNGPDLPRNRVLGEC